MNYIIKNNNPLDLLPSKGIGIKIPFDGSTGINITYNTKDSTRINLLNFLLTGTRERIMNPNFGSPIRNQIFEQITNNSIKNIEDILYNYIKTYFPQIKLNKQEISSEDNSIHIYLEYEIINTNINDNIQLTFQT